MKTYTINRSKWLRGEGNENSYLLRGDDGKMCCLGQVCEQEGVPGSELIGISEPAGLQKRKSSLPKWLFSEVAYEMMEENDTKAREERLKKLAVKAGVEFLFVD